MRLKNTRTPASVVGVDTDFEKQRLVGMCVISPWWVAAVGDETCGYLRDMIHQAGQEEKFRSLLQVSQRKYNVVGTRNEGLARRGILPLLHWQELEEWQQDNEYIVSGYRPASASFSISLKSLLYLHNETVNIYSHIIGAILFVALPIHVYGLLSTRYESAQIGDVIVFSTFFFGVAICFALSACYHIVSNHSSKVAAIGNQMDYLGIVILMWGSTIPSIYYGFYCDLRLQKLYWTVCTSLASCCIYATLHPKFRKPQLRPYRAAMYAGLGLSALIFVSHGIVVYGWETQSRRMSLSWMGLMALFNLLGAAAYAARVPERWVPERFDIFGSGHQILHIMVILAGLSHMFGLLNAFDHLHAQQGPCRFET